MSNETKAVYYFLPWVRYGLLKESHELPAIGKKALDTQVTHPVRVKVPIKLQLIGEKETEQIDKPMSLIGHGDIIGIDPREIIRTEPRNLTPDFPPYLFPFIEFDRPDFPWLFTPGKPDTDGCLLPWVVLVVVSKQNSRIKSDLGKPLPVLTCPVTELPDLEESWAWAHAQYVGNDEQSKEQIAEALNNSPAQNISRLICPRQLKENQGGSDGGYLACVVPAFQAGVKAGMGESSDDKLAPAWKITDTGEIDLPIYYHWEFGTGTKANFEAFIHNLNFLEKLPEGSTRFMDASDAGGGMPNYPGLTFGITSACQEMESYPTSPNAFSFQQELKKHLAPHQDNTGDITIQPPVYGGWYAQSATTERPSLDDAGVPDWLRTINVDPRYRVAAALGTQVVRQQQEQLMAAAWQQAGEIEAANQLLRQKQLGRVVTTSVYKRFGILTDDSFHQLTAPLVRHEQQTNGNMSFAATIPAIKENPISKALVSASFRRLYRPNGRLSRPTEIKSLVGNASESTAKIASLNENGGQLLVKIETGLLQVTQKVGVTSSSGTISGSRPTSISETQEEVTFSSVKLSSAQSNIPTARSLMMEQLNPDNTFNLDLARIDSPLITQRKLKVSSDIAANDDPLQPITNVPLKFLQPMFAPLRDLFQEMLIPGLDRIPNNSLLGLPINAAFIEAYMVGLNHEMTRELQWREFPTHLDNTYFRQFWDLGGNADTSPDLEEIKDWSGQLGTHLQPDRGSNLFILLIKGDLLLRYPNAVIYAQRAIFSVSGGATSIPQVDSAVPAVFPVMRINPVPGITFLGFNLSPLPNKIPNGDPGWFFIIEEHPTETRFGLGTSGVSELKSWRDLSWLDIKIRDNGYLRVMDSSPKPLENDPNVVWGVNSAHMAYITLQKAYRFKIHSSYWFGEI